jgi:SAM-dependent methyltransferase
MRAAAGPSVTEVFTDGGLQLERELSQVGDSLFHGAASLAKRFSRENLYEWLDEEVDRLRTDRPGEPLRVLNVGAGGDLYEHVRQLPGAEVIQIDIDPARHPDVVADVCKLDAFEDGVFECVFMMEVLEHVKEPTQALAEVRRVLKPNGRLIMSVPFVFPLHDEPHDFFRFTKYGLAHLLSDYETVTIRNRNDYVHAMLVLAGRAMWTSGRKQKVLGVAFFGYLLLQYPLLWLISRSFDSQQCTTGYFAVATKPA